jgi:hypothetical protein
MSLRGRGAKGGSKPKDVMTRIQANTRLAGDCKIYTGFTDYDGYGFVWYKGTNHRVHRVVAHLYLGLDLDDPDQQALHKPGCTSRACWNVEHLYVGTHTQNMRDKKLKREL